MRCTPTIVAVSILMLYASADARCASISTVQIFMGGTVTQFDTIHDTGSDFISYNNLNAAVGTEVAVLQHSDSAEVENASINLNASGAVTPGFMSGNLFGAMAAHTILVTGPGSRSGLADLLDSRVLLSTTDLITSYELDKSRIGTNIIVNAKWVLDGSLFIDKNKQEGRSSYDVRTSMGFSGTGITVQGGGLAREASSPVVHLSTQPLSEIFVQLHFVTGVPQTLTYNMSLLGSGTVSADLASPAGDAAVDFSDAFQHTLRWGGVTSVVNADTGMPLEGWTLTSESGFDWSKPYPVPEPSSLVLLRLVFWELLHRRCAGAAISGSLNPLANALAA